MQTLLLAFLRLPWWGYLIFAAGMVWLGETTSKHADAYRATVEQALAGPSPQLQSLTAGLVFEDDGVNEVALRAQIDLSQSATLVDTRNGIERSRNRLMALVPPDAGETPPEFRTFIVVPEAEADALLGWIEENTIAWGAVGPVVKLAGALDDHSSTTGHIRDVLAERGVALADNPLFLQPFTDGRSAGLRSLATGKDSNVVFIRLIALGIALIGIAQRVMAVVIGRGTAARREALFDGIDPDKQPNTADVDLPAALPGQAASMAVAAGSPLARIAARDAERQAEKATTPQGATLAARIMAKARTQPLDAPTCGMGTDAPAALVPDYVAAEAPRTAAHVNAAQGRAASGGPIPSSPSLRARIGGMFRGFTGDGVRRSKGTARMDPFERLAREQGAAR